MFHMSYIAHLLTSEGTLVLAAKVPRSYLMNLSDYIKIFIGNSSPLFK